MNARAALFAAVPLAAVALATPALAAHVEAPGTTFSSVVRSLPLESLAAPATDEAASSDSFAAGEGHAPAGADVLRPSVVSPAPEPETYALMIAGLGAIGWVARRKRKG